MDNVLSALKMEEFIKKGGYRSLKLAKEKKKRLVSGVRKHLQDSESKRHEFSRFGLVAKFSVRRDYQWDYIALNEYLYNLGLLPHVAKLVSDKELKKLDVYEELQDYRLPVMNRYVKPYFNKAGKAINQFNEETLDVYEQMHLDMLLTVFEAHHNDLKYAEDKYNKLKQDIMDCKTLQEKKKVKYEYGSISLVNEKEGYDIPAVAKDYGIDFLILNSQPDMSKLQKFILKGTISQSEVYQFRKDVTAEHKPLKFTLMKLEDEQKQIQMLSDQAVRASLNAYHKAY